MDSPLEPTHFNVGNLLSLPIYSESSGFDIGISESLNFFFKRLSTTSFGLEIFFS